MHCRSLILRLKQHGAGQQFCLLSVFSHAFLAHIWSCIMFRLLSLLRYPLHVQCPLCLWLALCFFPVLAVSSGSCHGTDAAQLCMAAVRKAEVRGIFFPLIIVSQIYAMTHFPSIYIYIYICRHCSA